MFTSWLQMELNLAKAHDMALKMGFSRAHLKRLKPQVPAAGPTPYCTRYIAVLAHAILLCNCWKEANPLAPGNAST